MGSTIGRVPRVIAHAVGLVGVVAVNTLAVRLPLNDLSTGALADMYPNLFVPAGVTFSIWGLIYLALLGFVGFGFAQLRKPPGPGPVEAVGPWFLVNCLANIGWIFAWHYLLHSLALVLMGVLLLSLVQMYRLLGTGVRPGPLWETLFMRAPISLYMGWISVATIANVTTLAVDLGAPAFGTGPALATVGMLGVAVALGVLMLWRRRDVVYALVLCWALFGIHLKRSGAPEAGSELVGTAATLGLGVLLVGVVATAVVKLRARAADHSLAGPREGA